MRLKTISRRTFLKSAGAAALVVTAAGVLAGCSSSSGSSKVPGTDVPDVPAVTSKTVNVIFTDVEVTTGTANVGDTYEMSVLKDAKVVDPTVIPADKIPAGYELADKTPVTIFEAPNGKDYAEVPVKKTVVIPDTKEIMVKLVSQDGKTFMQKVTVDKAATTVKPSEVSLPEGYEFDSSYDMNYGYPISDNFFFMIHKV